MSRSSDDSRPRRRVQISFECAFDNAGTPLWAEGHPEDVIRRNFVDVTDMRVEVDDAD